MDICELSVNGNSNRKGFIFPMNNQWRAFLCIVCNWLTLNLCQIQPDLVVHFEHLAKQKCKHANVVSIPKACVLWVKFTPPKSNIDTKKWWFGKCISFQNTAILAIYVQFQGGVSLSSWQDDFRPFHLPEKLRLASFLQAFLHLQGWANVPTTRTSRNGVVMSCVLPQEKIHGVYGWDMYTFSVYIYRD